jgi:hypothetical protein
MLACTRAPTQYSRLPTAGDARRGADAALEPVADHPGAAADVAFRDEAGTGRLERLEHMLLGHMQAVHVVEPLVAGFGHHGQQPRVGPRSPPWRTIQRTSAWCAMPTECVFVRAIGPRKMPASSIQCVPVISPLPLSA